METRQHQCGLGDGEGTAHLAIVGELVVGADDLGRTEVDAAQHDVRLTTGLDIGLDGGLPVELDGKVDDIAALHETERRGVGPTAGNVDAHGGTPPDNLITVDCEAGQGTGAEGRGKHAFAQKGEGTLLVGSGFGLVAFQRVEARAEHGIADAGEQGLVLGQRMGQGQSAVNKVVGGGIEIGLIEHAVAVVRGEAGP